MSALLRSLLVLSVTSLFVVGCGEKAAPPEAATSAPVEAAPAPVEAAPVAEATPGGYEPTAEERVPGITLDAAAVEATPAEAVPAAE
ncbi:MAG: hypothetical protein Q8L73_05275 [Methylotenera sp.]|nr:hypothetical protein [Methylotenera sp.]